MRYIIFLIFPLLLTAGDKIITEHLSNTFKTYDNIYKYKEIKIIATPKKNGFISISGGHGMHCHVTIRKENGKIIGTLKNITDKLESEVNKKQKYFITIYALNNFCKKIDIFVP
ncbi:MULTISPECIES: hypothetical protein [unclassified Nitratiruptor]|uniref:hypothetical protein n=1 Tax=unclassified Nitratiruptor TaxID=2624044 RepID=UPI00191689DE|nr:MULTISPECIES: hypothetical protein [unclassified Nitratiruptor]BCD60029.1 hypothetical protein NitYY0810_C0792 [Nitratiruptor sp. YY08-10]